MSSSHFISYHQPVLLVALWMIYEAGGALGDEEGGPCSWITLLQLHVQPRAPGSLPFHRSSTVKSKKKGGGKEGKKERKKEREEKLLTAAVVQILMEGAPQNLKKMMMY